MPVYEYRGLNSSGKTLKGILDAESDVAAREKLRSSGIFPVEVKETLSKARDVPTGPGSLLRIVRGVKAGEVSAMTRQLSTLLGAGVPLVRSLESIIAQMSNPQFKRVVAQIKESVNQGNSLAFSLSQHPRIFSNVYVNMVQSGEASGSLDVVLDRLAEHGEHQQALRGRFRAALAYPIFMFFVGAVVLFVLIIASILYEGIEIGTGNHVVQIPLIRYTLDSSLYPHDIYVQSLMRYYSLYLKVLALVSQWLGLSNCLILAHLLCRSIFFTGIFSLAYMLFGKGHIALLSVLLSLFGLRAILAGEEIMGEVTTHTQFAQSLMPWAIMFLWHRSFIVFGLLLGLICQINFMLGVQVAIVAAITIMFDWRKSCCRQLFVSILLCGIISGTAVLWAYKTPQPDIPMQEYLQVLKRTFFYHMFPLLSTYRQLPTAMQHRYSVKWVSTYPHGQPRHSSGRGICISA